MDTKQQYLDDMRRRGMLPADGPAPTTLSPPAYYCQPYISDRMTPEEWSFLVFRNFVDVYLAWWKAAFLALRDVAPDPQAMTKTVVPVYQPDTQLWELQLKNLDGTKEE